MLNRVGMGRVRGWTVSHICYVTVCETASLARGKELAITTFLL